MPEHLFGGSQPAYLDVDQQQWTGAQHFMSDIAITQRDDSVQSETLLIKPATNRPGVKVEATSDSGACTFFRGSDPLGGFGFAFNWAGLISIFKDDVAGVFLSPTNMTLTQKTQSWSDIVGSFVMVGNGANPPSGAFEMARVSLTAQSAAITATNLTDTTPAGLYEVSYYASTTTANPTDGTIALRLHYTDRVGATTQTAPVPLALGAVSTGDTAHKGVLVAYLASGNIQYSTVLVGAQTTSRYALEVRCKFLG